jgi:hypothetical protein
MALWGNNDNVGSEGTVSLDYSTGVVTGAGTSFGLAGQGASEGDVIRFGDRSTTYFGDAVIVSIASTTSLTIGSTAGLSGAAISGVEFNVSQLPKYTVLDSKYSEASYGTEDSYVYGVNSTGIATGSQFETGVGWVGVTTYNDNEGNLRVKKEILVALSGITTGNAPAYPPA